MVIRYVPHKKKAPKSVRAKGKTKRKMRCASESRLLASGESANHSSSSRDATRIGTGSPPRASRASVLVANSCKSGVELKLSLAARPCSDASGMAMHLPRPLSHSDHGSLRRNDYLHAYSLRSKAPA